ncbi:uncharacterized protein Z519_07935 [Cladophialophora bantiana CBS 173.52]|uniref:Trafficking protein particle complex II-specific subunit 65 IgD3 domain-containing protein n=1 Tax=Cladophialophora bantiana (strain ATCC 10958 / CBS 173.52 / CDC B-1940 / NIH 8579) TaxID=1442370 RepID=A0A0D2EM38_CLAB1|nr:uncharacterized protein Z519_07935 [Cladophialophora bantiana CBS 173.52]KIW91041.1 hypothetical protein Z519_07935 [Cladophialophora bantiana CBS 173.52]
MEAELFKLALVDAIIPEDTVTEVSEILQAGAEAQNDSSHLLAIKERELLFFDERLRTLAVIRLPHCDEDVLQSYLSQLSFKIDVWAIEESPGNEQNNPGAPLPKDMVFSAESIQKTEPIVLVSESANRCQTLTLVWEVEISLNRPKFRVPQPAIILIPSATITAPQRDEVDKNDDLALFQPLEANVLEPMRFVPGFRDNAPYLAASRLERVLPITATHKKRIHLQHVPSRRYRAVPATMARIRYQKVNAFTTTPTTVALLDIDIIPFVKVDVTIEQVDLSLKNGRTESMMPTFLPMQVRSGDCITFLYWLHQTLGPSRAPGFGLVNPNIDVLSIAIRLAIQLNEECHPVLIMNWTTHVDFTPALNPSFGPPSQPIQRPNRPTSLPVNADNSAAVPVNAISTSLQPVSDVDSRSGLSISFSAPDAPVQVGQPFSWKVLVMNNSMKTAKIAVIPLPRIQRQTTQTQFFAKRHAPKSSTASFHPNERRHTKDGEDLDIAQAIVDENVVYAMHHSHSVPPETDLMALTAELRIGPLAPDQCHESEIQMVAFEAGTLRVDAMRVVDLVREVEEGAAAMGVLADIRDLPDIVVAKAADEST